MQLEQQSVIQAEVQQGRTFKGSVWSTNTALQSPDSSSGYFLCCHWTGTKHQALLNL